MKIVHRISLRLDLRQRRQLEAHGLNAPIGIQLPGGGSPFVAFDIDEEHRNWGTLRELFARWKAVDISRSEFSKKEIADAHWLALEPDWHHGYPQPDELEFGYQSATYHLEGFCPQCGIGKKQRAAFQMKSEPKWGQRSILQLNWIFDEFFVKPDVWAAIFRPRKIACREVADTRGRELKTVVQLVIDHDSALESTKRAFQVCNTCRRIKYLPLSSGPFPPPKKSPSCDIMKTMEFFGDGASAFRAIVISRDLAQAFKAGGIRGVTLRPVEANKGGGF